MDLVPFLKPVLTASRTPFYVSSSGSAAAGAWPLDISGHVAGTDSFGRCVLRTNLSLCGSWRPLLRKSSAAHDYPLMLTFCLCQPWDSATTQRWHRRTYECHERCYMLITILRSVWAP